MRDGINFSDPLIKPRMARKPKQSKLTPLSSSSIDLGITKALESTRGDKDDAEEIGKSSRKRTSQTHKRREFRDLLIRLKAITEDLIANLDE